MNDRFRTILQAESAPFSIDFKNKILCAGSCFAEHIGSHLRERKFPTLINPHGILYNPASLADMLYRLMNYKLYRHSDLIEYQGLWHSFAFHGRFSHIDHDTALRQMNEAHQTASDWFKKTDRLLLTFGTADVFENKKSGNIVANCHKVPASNFIRRRLSVEQITDCWTVLIEKLLKDNSGLCIILTVSPVRHLRDGLIENQRSKATLLLAVDQLSRQFEQVHYFPGYELLLDDLRDYRFYKADLAHPNEQAIDYIWQFFKTTFFKKETLKLLSEIEKLLQAVNHRPLFPDTPQHQTFIKKQLKKMEELESRYSFLDLEEERRRLIS